MASIRDLYETRALTKCDSIPPPALSHKPVFCTDRHTDTKIHLQMHGQADRQTG